MRVEPLTFRSLGERVAAWPTAWCSRLLRSKFVMLEFASSDNYCMNFEASQFIILYCTVELNFFFKLLLLDYLCLKLETQE